MEEFEVAKIKKDVNDLFRRMISGEIPDVLLCRRCGLVLERCSCKGKCDMGKHNIKCECVSLFNLIYHVAEAAEEGQIETSYGFLV